ncbi:MAG: DMT family transporter [Clostridium sp.]
MLLLAALVWGIAFVAQSEGLNYVETFTFNTCRFLLGGAVLIPCIFFMHGRKDSIWQTLSEKEKKEQTRMGIIGGICCGCVLCLASRVRQFTVLGRLRWERPDLSRLCISSSCRLWACF